MGVGGVSKVSELLCQWVNQMAHCKKNSNQQMSFWIYTTTTVNPLYNHTLGDHFLVTLINCDLNIYSHIPYKPLQDCGYMQKSPYRITLYARVNVSIVKFLNMGYSKIKYVLLDLKKVVISICFSVKFCIEFGILDY
jgi:hypothetical protein